MILLGTSQGICPYAVVVSFRGSSYIWMLLSLVYPFLERIVVASSFILNHDALPDLGK
jgi:hypothetical protein